MGKSEEIELTTHLKYTRTKTGNIRCFPRCSESAHMEHSFCGNCIEGVLENLTLSIEEYEVVGHFIIRDHALGREVAESKKNMFKGKVFQAFDGSIRFAFHPGQKWKIDCKKSKNRMYSLEILLRQLETQTVIAKCESTSFVLNFPKRVASNSSLEIRGEKVILKQEVRMERSERLNTLTAVFLPLNKTTLHPLSLKDLYDSMKMFEQLREGGKFNFDNYAIFKPLSLNIGV